MTRLSILVPTYNDRCLQLVKDLHQQASAVAGLSFEIIVGDDASTDADVVRENEQVASLPHTTFFRAPHNEGRSAIRNRLGRMAKGQWLLFIDSDMTMVRQNFIASYLAQTTTGGHVFYGGYAVVGDANEQRHNLRFRYEKFCEEKHAVAQRKKNPFKDFHTSNFLILKELYIVRPLDERFRFYGYEDVFYGRQLQEVGETITHIDNPLAFATFEDNAHFVEKTEEATRTLLHFSDDLAGFSPLLAYKERLRALHLDGLYKKYFSLRRCSWRKKLCSEKPSLLLFSLYKLGLVFDD